MAAAFIVKVRCKHCEKRLTANRDEGTCQCLLPMPVRIVMKMLPPLKSKQPQQPDQAVACAS